MGTIKLEPADGIDVSGDAIHETALQSYLGVITAGSVTRKTLTAAYQNVEAIDSALNDVIDMQDLDKIFVIADVVLAATDVRIRFMWGNDDDTAKLLNQEVREDNSTALLVNYEFVEHVFTATGRYLVEVPRLARFVKIQPKVTGAPGTLELALGIVGQRRRGA